MKTRTIILMEDDTELRELYRLSLEAAGYDVIAQDNSKGIAQLIENHRPALVVTDIVMPDSDGIEGILKIIDKSSVPIIAVSSYAKYLKIVEHLATACLTKPLSGQRLVEEVNNILDAPQHR